MRGAEARDLFKLACDLDALRSRADRPINDAIRSVAGTENVHLMDAASAALVGLNPILLAYGVGGAHNDLIMLTLAVAGIALVLREREGLGAGSVVAGAAIKSSVIVILPLLVLGVRRRARALIGGLVAIAVTGAVALIGFQPASGQVPLTLVGAIDLPRVEGRIDHLAVDTAAQRLYVAALGNNTVEVLDLKGNSHLKSLPGFKEPQGIAVVSDAKAAAIANGQGEGVQFIDASDYHATRAVKLGDDSDNVRYDSGAKRLFVGFGSGALAAISPAMSEKGLYRSLIRVQAIQQWAQTTDSWGNC